MNHLAYDLNIGWPMANKKCHTKIIFFSEKKVVCHVTFHIQLTMLNYDDSLVVLDPVTA